MAGADLPVGMAVRDAYDNSLAKTIETYKIHSDPAQGQFMPGSGVDSAEIQEFGKPVSIYRALATPAQVTFTASGKNTAGVLITSTKKIDIKEGFVDVAPKTIQYTLTDTVSYPEITIQIHDKK